MITAAKKIINDPRLALTPLEAGRLVLRGMRNNDLYILSHPEFAPIMRARSEALMASIPTDLRPTDERLAHGRAIAQSSIYGAERDRQLCAHAAGASKAS